jgi:hypothetical protein|tara:strand:- start:38 stop:622 length:585 start_codon:yes stop_codon:yes gene_type:complete
MKQSIDFLTTQIARLEEKGYEIPDKQAYIDNILDYMEVVREIESSNDNTQVNAESGGAGFYQFIKDSIPTAKNRAKRMHTAEDYVANIPDNALEWDDDQAGLMFLAHAFGAPINEKRTSVGSDELFHRIGTNFDPQAQQDLYMNYHYREVPDDATVNRANSVIGEFYLENYPETAKNSGGPITSPLYSDKRYLI